MKITGIFFPRQQSGLFLVAAIPPGRYRATQAITLIRCLGGLSLEREAIPVNRTFWIPKGDKGHTYKVEVPELAPGGSDVLAVTYDGAACDVCLTPVEPNRGPVTVGGWYGSQHFRWDGPHLIVDAALCPACKSKQ